MTISLYLEHSIFYSTIDEEVKTMSHQVSNGESYVDIKKLVELTEGFIHLTQILLDNGKITEEQYTEMTRNKLRFLNDIGKNEKIEEEKMQSIL